MNKNEKNNVAVAENSTMNAVKRAKSVVVYDKNNNARLVAVVKENEAEYQLKNNKKVERATAVANVSKNRFNVYEDKKSYHSHVEAFKDVHDLAQLVQTVFDDVKETQYFITCNDRTIKLRIQSQAVEIMCLKLENRENVKECANDKDFKKYKYFLTANDRDTVVALLNSLK